MKRQIRFAATSFAALALVAGSTRAGADNGTDTSDLRDGVTLEGIRAHQEAFQDIADDNGGTRQAGTSGHVESAAYVAGLLTNAGYVVSFQEFSYDSFVENGPAVLEQISPDSVAYGVDIDFATMSYSGSEDVTAILEAVDLDLPPSSSSTSGCEASDFDDFTAGNIALIQRGTCSFALKAQNAEAAGAIGVIIFNEGNTDDRVGLLFGTLGADADVTVPVVGSTFALGEALSDLDGIRVRLAVDATTDTIETYNVLADTPTGRTDRIVVAGGHLDSVAEGPGINDNGSGTAALLETALQMAALDIKPRNMVRFAFWSGEEDGLVGSQYYVDQLSAKEVKRHALNLNFDMIGSPNFVRFIYDGDGSATGTAGPNGSNVVESVFESYFESQGLATEPTAFDGRSDYGPFIDVGIPAGGLFTGAEEIKTEEQADVFGGTAGEALDPCYHQECDTFDNNSNEALDQMSDAVAHSVLTFAETTSSVNGTTKGNGGQPDMERKGARFLK